GYYQQQHYRGSWDQDPSNVGPRALRRFSPQGGFNYGRFLEVHVEGDIGIGDLVYAGGLSSQDFSRLYDFSDYSQYGPYATFINPLTCASDPSSGPGNHGCKAPTMYGEVGGTIERASNELRLQSKAGAMTQWIVGAYWEKTHNPYHGVQHMPNINFNGAP